METVYVIPKNSAPASLGELRNLSCTPLFSKVLESFVLSRLQSEIKLSSKQYGGVKNCGTDHFLVDTWNRIITILEHNNSAANLVSIDFEKAFNRMDHEECLKAICSMGASMTSVDWVAAFLYGRHMQVKINNDYSTPRPVPGGSPQGSILGNFLFCCTTDQFTALAENVGAEEDWDWSSDDEDEDIQSGINLIASTPRPESRMARGAENAEISMEGVGEEEGEEEESFRFWRPRNNLMDTTLEPEDLVLFERPDCTTNDPLECLVYIDDFNSIERLNVEAAESHISTRKTKLRAHAKKSETLFKNTKILADEVGMRVNERKTQMLCIHSCINNELSTYIKPNEVDSIESTSELKILGFKFNNKPDASFHVSKLIDKFYSRMWTLRFLKRGGMAPADLIKVYETIIRPAIEYSSVVYHTLIPQYQAEKLEALQRMVYKIIYGHNNNYEDMLEDGRVERLEERREKNILKFAKKSLNNERFSRKWFPVVVRPEREVRDTTRRPYLERKCRTTRMKNNPVQYMAKILNDSHNN